MPEVVPLLAIEESECLGVLKGINCYVILDKDRNRLPFTPKVQVIRDLKSVLEKSLPPLCQDHIDCPMGTHCYKNQCVRQEQETCAHLQVTKENRYHACLPKNGFAHECTAGVCRQMCKYDSDCDVIFPERNGHCSILKESHSFGHCLLKSNTVPWYYIAVPILAFVALVAAVFYVYRYRKRRQTKQTMSSL